jgi:predicted ribosome quality control (RQC) complex YloA/Tae2 family protein
MERTFESLRAAVAEYFAAERLLQQALRSRRDVDNAQERLSEASRVLDELLQGGEAVAVTPEVGQCGG